MELNFIEAITSSWWPIIFSLIIGAITSIREFAAGGKCTNTTQLDGQKVIITGGATGIGLSVAQELTKRKAHVIIACRNVIDGEKAKEHIESLGKGVRVDVHELDVSKMASIRKFAAIVEKEYETIDVLINNAAVAYHEYCVTEEGIELTFATNYLGHFLLSHLLLPALIKSETNGRIVNMSAGAHQHATFDLDNFNFAKEFQARSVFGQTKLLMVMMSVHMSQLLRSIGEDVTVNAVNPGIVRGTKHLRSTPLGDSLLTRIAVSPWTWLFLKNTNQGAQSAIYVATDKIFKNVSGQYISDCEIGQMTALVHDKTLMQGLYEQSCKRCGIEGLPGMLDDK